MRLITQLQYLKAEQDDREFEYCSTCPDKIKSEFIDNHGKALTNLPDKEKPKLSENHNSDVIRKKILDIQHRFMKLSASEIKGYQAQINRKLTEREVPHMNGMKELILTQEEVDMLPDYEKQLYKEALLMRRHLDIQQKIHKKSRIRD